MPDFPHCAQKEGERRGERALISFHFLPGKKKMPLTQIMPPAAREKRRLAIGERLRECQAVVSQPRRSREETPCEEKSLKSQHGAAEEEKTASGRRTPTRTLQSAQNGGFLPLNWPGRLKVEYRTSRPSDTLGDWLKCQINRWFCR